MLTAPCSQQATQTTGFAGLRNMPGMILDGSQQLARPGMIPDQLAAASGMAGQALMPDPAMPPVATTVAADVAGQPVDVPLSNNPAQNAAQLADLQPSGEGEGLPTLSGVQAEGDSPATAPDEQVLDAESVSQPNPARPDPISQPTAQPIAQPIVQATPEQALEQPATPVGENADSAIEQAPVQTDAGPVPVDQPESDPDVVPSADDMPETADGVVVAMPADGVVEAVPAPPTRQPSVVSDEPTADGIAQDDSKISVSARDARQAPDAAAPRSTAAQASDNGSARDFAQLVKDNGADAAASASEGGDGAADMLTQARLDPAKPAVDTVKHAGSVPGTVSARPGEIGRELGVEIARHTRDGRDSLTIRLDPAEMGEIHIRLQFDDKGTMRAHVTAESAAALDMLRRDSGDLARALGDAGVRTDGQSFQFEARSQGRGDQQGQQNRPEAHSGANTAQSEAEGDDGAQPARAKRLGSGSLDLFA
ncbi:flagellar hook-length control protein FliK [Alteriqipengyuania sp. NZ-12B]|uniref:Flagellar hook-length control protein FliK n=1 Tax=Alteriqipengyuania abyssalis TaxID=2860200 RepID=A0ABS7PFM4_9SPHN|nr:flagellar hook-length control protein FliK [Alteriqipengyuania abyssalis]MBY8337865.1 flagellar hook-length control protein FliK [Alteriqipengyuania abyssalis]